MFITIHDKGHVYEVLKNWPEQDVRCIVVTDGERIPGLGDLGAQGMGIPVGKLSLNTAIAGIPPSQCLPITLDVGTNRQELLDDIDYIGLRHKRVTGQQYDDFVDEFMQAVVRRYGQNTLIQFEDFGNHNAFRLLEKYQNKYCTFNDDIQGTASVAVAGILAALKATNTKLSDHTFLFEGAGEAALGIANLIGMAVEKREGIPYKEAIKKVWLKDSRGLIVKDRPEGGISDHKAPFAQEHAPMDDLGDIVKELKPTVLIGANAVPNVFTPEIIKDMATFNKQPVIFALSNPTSKAECTAEQAYIHSEGRVVFASGSPFPTYNGFGKTYEPGQGNNAYIFPGVSLGVICTGVNHISDSVFLSAAEGLADMVQDSDIAVGRLYPPLSALREISIKIATKVAIEAYKSGTASTYPEPEDKEAFIRQQLYDYAYDTALPARFEWSEEAFTNRSVPLLKEEEYGLVGLPINQKVEVATELGQDIEQAQFVMGVDAVMGDGWSDVPVVKFVDVDECNNEKKSLVNILEEYGIQDFSDAAQPSKDIVLKLASKPNICSYCGSIHATKKGLSVHVAFCKKKVNCINIFSP